MNELHFSAPCQGVLIIRDSFGNTYYQGLLQGEQGTIPNRHFIEWYPATNIGFGSHPKEALEPKPFAGV